MMKKDYKSELLKFIDFHIRSFASSSNSINAIISSNDILSQIVDSFNLLKKDYSVLFYSGRNTDTKRFLEKLIQDLRHEKSVLIVADTLNFDPIIFDQLVQFREENKLTVNLNNSDNGFPPNSKIFLFYQSNTNDRSVYEIADHVLNLMEVN